MSQKGGGKWRSGGCCGKLGSPDVGRKDRKREVEQSGLKLEKWCTRKRKAASQGTERAAGGRDGREGGKGGRWRKS